MGKVLVDSCIFIDIFRGNKQLYQDLLKLEISISSIVYMELMKKFSISYGLLIPDALIAGTAIIKKLPLWTFNHKDFKFIDNLVLFKAAGKDNL